ncbi:hypothetical protein N7451_005625 [Penicillium sp. IBT 35674x]|nr:hypothetical protein N7451_005625 [Penicillium sp. IBT 35674x]
MKQGPLSVCGEHSKSIFRPSKFTESLSILIHGCINASWSTIYICYSKTYNSQDSHVVTHHTTN